MIPLHGQVLSAGDALSWPWRPERAFGNPDESPLESHMAATLSRTKTSPLEKAESALVMAEAHLRQAREEMPDSYEERLAILEANTEAVLDGVKRVTGAKDG